MKHPILKQLENAMQHVLPKIRWAFAFTLAVSFGESYAGIVVSNLDQPVVGINAVGAVELGMPPFPFNDEYAQEFRTGSQDANLGSVEASLGAATGSFSGIAELVTDNNNSPGATVLTGFTFPAVPVNNLPFIPLTGPYADLSFAPTTTGLILSANTSYWFILGASGSGNFQWQFTDSAAVSGVGTLPNTAFSNSPGSWSVDPDSEEPFLIQVNSVPEPSSLISGTLAGLIGLGVFLGRRSSYWGRRGSFRRRVRCLPSGGERPGRQARGAVA
jgi:hypothetical protein